MKNQTQTWKEFWGLLGTSRDPIAATDRPTVLPETYQLYGEEIIQKLALNKDDVLLDIGCGTGVIDVSLAKHVRQVVATDFLEVMTRRAKDNTASWGNVRLVICDSTAMPFKDGICSKLVMYAVAQYMSHAQLDQMLAEARRLVRPRGLIMLGEIPRLREVSLWSRIKDVWTHQGLLGITYKVFDNLRERWLRFAGQWTHRFVRPEGPPITLHSEEELLKLARKHHMRGTILPQDARLPWFHQTFDLVIENIL